MTQIWELEVRLSDSAEDAAARAASIVIERLRMLRTVGDVRPNEWRVIYPYFANHWLALDALHRELDGIDPGWHEFLVTEIGSVPARAQLV